MKLAAVLIVLLGSAGPGLGGLAPPPAAATPAATRPAPADSVLRTAIAAELATEAGDVAQLTTRLGAAADPATALQLVRDLEARKQETCRRLLLLQLARARSLGRAPLVAALEATLAARDAAPPPSVPATRPLPPAAPAKGDRP